MNRRSRVFVGAAMLLVGVTAIVLWPAGNTSTQTAAPAPPLLSAPTASLGTSAEAQPSDSLFSPTQTLGPQAVTQITPGFSSRPLRDLSGFVGPVPPRPEAVEPPGESYPVAKDRGAFRDPALQSRSFPNVMPGPVGNFDGLQNQDNVTLVGGSARPPDSEGEVGPNHYVEWINLVLRVYNKTGAPAMAAVPGNAIFSGLPNTSLCNTQNNGDPLVVYDQLADRWVLSQFAFNGLNMAGAPTPPYEQCVAVSKTNDPTGAYCLYDFNVSNTDFNDYGKIGVWPDGYYFSFGMFTGGAAYSGPGAMVVERPQMLQAACPAAKSAFYHLTSSPLTNATLPEGLPSDVDGTLPPPAGSPNYFLFPGAVTNDNLELWKFQVVDWTPAIPVTTMTASNLITVPAYDPSVTCSPTSRHCVPQAGTTNKLDLVGNRLMYRLAYRNWGPTPPGSIPANTESLVTNESVDSNSPANRVGVRWYEIRSPNSSPVAYQAATYAPADSDHRWMASAAQDSDGNLAIGFTASGSISPTAKWAGRLESDTINTLAQGEATMFAGPASADVATATAGDQRWGDYSHLSTDPLDDCTFWYTTEYMTNTNLSIDAPTVKRNWGTRIGSFRFPTCSGSPTAVRVRGLAARWQGRAIRVTWRTTNEASIAGFNVYRSVNAGAFRKLNRTIVRAKSTGAVRGTVYAFKDAAVKRGRTYTYRLQIVSSAGKRDWYGVGSAAIG